MYAELHCLSNFSFLRGASHPHELVARAAELGYEAIAITDECSLAGVVKAHVAAAELGIHLLIGAHFVLEEGFTVVALAPSRTAYSELSALITLARRRSPKGEYQLRLRDLEYNLRHNLLIWLPSFSGVDNHQHAQILKNGFADRLWLGVSNLLRGDEPERYDLCYQLARRWRIPMVACGGVNMHTPERGPLQDALTAIFHNTSVQQLGRLRAGNAERYLRAIARLQTLYPAPLLQESVAIARRCHFSMRELQYEYPPEVVPPALTPAQYLRHLVLDGANRRWPGDVPAAMHAQIEKELALIAEKQYEYYFLTVHDMVEYAFSQGIFCQGRGSAANSVVCYCLRITEVSPEKSTLLFERFISRERNEPPDIDVDFEHERREEIIQYIYKKYGRERAALAATVICYRRRSAIRDIGKALGLDALFIDQLAKSLAWWDKPEELAELFRARGFSGDTRIAGLFFVLVQQLRGFPRHLSQHVGGFLISKGPVSALVPVENASMPERTVIQWDKEDIEAMKLLKVDVLALGMLTAIRKTLALLQEDGETLSIAGILQHEDSDTYAMLQRADTVGVFQVESRAQMSMLPRLKPREFYDLVIQIAIVRPGPIQGNMVHPYLQRRQNPELVTYDNDEMKAVLKRTLGVPIFQEQVIKLAMVAAGFSGGEADELRRAMASWGKNGNLERFKEKLVNGMLGKGYAREFAERLFEQMKGFGAYGFPESHSASFALLAYVSAWLKCHRPAAFYCGLLNSQPMGFYSPSQLVQDARRHAIEVRPLDVRYSHYDHTLEKTTPGTRHALRLGLRLSSGFGKDAAERLVSARGEKPFASIRDVRRRAALNRAQLAALIETGALQCFSGHRHQGHWQTSAIDDTPPLALEGDDDDGIALPAPTEIQDITADYNSTGLTLGRHPMTLLRERHELFRRCKRHSELSAVNHGRFVRIAGIVTGRQRPGTESGVIFLTLEDETGNTNVVIWENVQQRCREALLKAKLLLVKGVVETDQSVLHVIAGQLIDCSDYLQDMQLESRDFH